jgi:CRP-like cAMP-binding protein
MPVPMTLLSDLPLFKGLTSVELEEIAAYLEQIEMPGKATIIKEGDEPNHPLYILLAGSVEVLIRGYGDREHLITSLNAPSVFGEVEALARRPAVAGVYSTTPIKLAILRRGTFDELQQQKRPSVLKMISNIARTLAYRLAATDARLAAYFSGDRNALGDVRNTLYLGWHPEG